MIWNNFLRFHCTLVQSSFFGEVHLQLLQSMSSGKYNLILRTVVGETFQERETLKVR